jgi:hypothetical protein
MSEQRIEDYWYEEEPNQCRNCWNVCEERSEIVSCQFCHEEFATGRSLYRCIRCRNEWRLGPRKRFSSEKDAVCCKCQQSVVGNCAICGKAALGSQSRNFDGAVVCNDCLETPESIWCPECRVTFPYHGYLKGVFRDDRPGLHAAALVTHYRHDHVRSHDRAWQNPRYAAKIPNYDYDERKAQTNNNAKRQIIRAIAKHVSNGTYPETAPIGARELVRAFGRLQEADEKTEELIVETLNKLGQNSSSAET